MLLAIKVTESIYGGLHGVETIDIIEISDKIKDNKSEIENIVSEYVEQEGEYLISSYGLEKEYKGFEPEYSYQIAKVKDEFLDIGEKNLSILLYNLSFNIFIEKYCEEFDL